MFKDYSLALFNDGDSSRKQKKKSMKEILTDIQLKRKTDGIDYSTLKHFGVLPVDHPARQYVDRRMLPHDRIFYAPIFNVFLRQCDIDPYVKEQWDHLKIPAIVIPFWAKKRLSRVFQIRTFDPKFKPKYITFKAHEDDLKIFGRERLNPHKPIYIVEGPFDAMGLPNSLAFSGASAELPKDVQLMKNKAFFLDNEPRNKDVVKQIQKLIKAGEKVVILPDRIQHKDINDMVLAGLDVEKIFKQHTYQGAVAQLKFDKWKRIKITRRKYNGTRKPIT